MIFFIGLIFSISLTIINMIQNILLHIFSINLLKIPVNIFMFY